MTSRDYVLDLRATSKDAKNMNKDEAVKLRRFGTVLYESMMVVTIALTSSQDENVFAEYIYDVAVIELIVDVLKKDYLYMSDQLLSYCLLSLDRALNYNLFSSDDTPTSFNIKSKFLAYNGEEVLNDLLGYKNEEIASFAIKIHQDYIEQLDEHEIMNTMEMA